MTVASSILPAADAAPAVAVESLAVNRGGREVLHGISFAIARGSITGFIGSSGCGKSSVMPTTRWDGTTRQPTVPNA